VTILTCIYINAMKFEETISFYKLLLNKDIEGRYEDRWAQIKISEELRLAFLNPVFDRDAVSEGRNLEQHYNQAFIENMPDKYSAGNSIILNCKAEDLHKEYERVRQFATGDISPIQYVNYMFPYHFFLVKDPEGNIIEIADV